MGFVADVVNGEDDRNARPEGGGVGGSVNEIDAGPRGRARQADQRPAGIA